MQEPGQRLQKYLAERGVASRRGAADVIRAGRVAVDGKSIREAGYRVGPTSHVALDGVEIEAERPRTRTIMLHKPRGYICSRDATQGKSVFELVSNVPERIVPVGRLDKNSEGLLLLSSDGELVDRLTHPRYGQEKAYEVTVSGNAGPERLRALRSRMLIDGYRIQSVRVTQKRKVPDKGRVVLEFVLREGRNRQIRKMCDAVGLTIHRLKRTRIHALVLRGLKPGEWRDLATEELAMLGADEPR